MGLTNRFIMDYNVDAIEREIMLKFFDFRLYLFDNDVYVFIRYFLLFKQFLSNTPELLAYCIAYNVFWREAIC